MAGKQAIHLVGSMPLDSAEDVFRTVCGATGGNVRRVPDGETGMRINWIRCIQDMLTAHPDFEVDPETPPLQWRQWDGKFLREIPQLKFKDGVDPDSVVFTTPYREEAVRSFEVFDRLRADGVIPDGIKFQVCVPTPLAPGYNYVAPRARADFIRVFGDHIVEAVAQLADRLPREQLALQWDVCQEVLMWEGYYDHRPDDFKEEILAVLGRVGDAVPEPVELGYHLCYGSPKDEHLIQPVDAANLVEILNGLFQTVRRSIQFVHIPVPRDRADAAYFEPLRGLNIPHETDLYLGLVHYDDVSGNDRRLDMACRYAKVDGVATECGWGRADPERVPGYLESLCRSADHLAARG